jgi:MoaE-MoaD fusion protein
VQGSESKGCDNCHRYSGLRSIALLWRDSGGGTSLDPVQITVKVFGGLKALAERDTFTLEVPTGATVADALASLHWFDDEVPLVVAVNREYADRSRRLEPDDEIALIPPVSGGAQDAPPNLAEQIHVEMTDRAIDEGTLREYVLDPRAGAIVAFTGITREVPALEYEAYAEMAEAEIRAIASQALNRHGLCRVAVAHRHGTVKLSEASVAIAVSSPHRAEAFAGAREIIDELKLRAPIWKREEDRWLPGHLPEPRSGAST